MFWSPQPVQLVWQVLLYTSKLYGSTLFICIAMPSWLIGLEERETPQCNSQLYCSMPPVCPKAWKLQIISGHHSFFSAHVLFPQGLSGISSQVFFASRKPPVPRTGTRVHSDVPRYHKPERGCMRMFPGTKNRKEGTFAKTALYETALLFPLELLCSLFTVFRSQRMVHKSRQSRSHIQSNHMNNGHHTLITLSIDFIKCFSGFSHVNFGG